jgi:putative membrane protein insertion efficiency factor
VFCRFICSVSPFVPCSARSSGLGCSGSCSSISSQPGAEAERAVSETDTMPCTKGPWLLGLWTSIPPVQGVRTLGVSQCLRVVLRPVLIAGIVVYQSILRPSMFGSCRFYPTCSIYAINAFHHHGLMTAMILILWRIIRCNPWGPCGYDPVPSSLFSSS